MNVGILKLNATIFFRKSITKKHERKEMRIKIICLFIALTSKLCL
jgi:hypothetical protein